MVHFEVIILFVVAELSCLRHTLVFGERDLDVSSQKADVQRHRTKRFLWGGKVTSLVCSQNFWLCISVKLFLISLIERKWIERMHLLTPKLKLRSVSWRSFESVKCDHSHDSSCAVISLGKVCFPFFFETINIDFYEFFLIWPFSSF